MIDINQPKISIITPAFNASNYIEETIQSVIGQTYKNWELIITDDASDDNTYKVISSMAQKDNRIKIFRNIENSGPALSRNNSINKSTGKYLAFLDSDDLWLPNKLELQVRFMIKNNSGFCFTGFRRFNQIKIGKYINAPKEIDYNSLLKNTIIATSTVILDKSKIPFDIKMKKVYYDDFALWLEILKTEIVAMGLDEDLMRYRVLPKSVSRNKLKSAMKVFSSYRQIEKLGYFTSLYYFFHWSFNSIKKYKTF